METLTETTQYSSIAYTVIGGTITLLWIMLLIVGTATIQQIREMHEVVTIPNSKRVWIFYSIYAFIAVLLFLISLIILWL